MKIMIFDCTCPECGQIEGPCTIGQSLWFYCRTHKVKWIVGYDLSLIVDKEAQRRRYDEMDFGDFKYLGPDAAGYEQAMKTEGGI